MFFIIIKLSLPDFSDAQTNYFGNLNCINLKKGVCNSCILGYTLNNGLCVLSCIRNCKLCLNNSICLKCIQGYYLQNNNQTCTQCPTPCNDCILTAENKLACNKCNNMIWDGSTCFPSNRTQIPCLNNNSNTSIKCPTCGNLCNTCLSNSNNITRCTSCVNNAIFDKYNYSNCICKNGYFNNNSKCIGCTDVYGSYCTSCDKNNCLSCYSRNDCVLFPEKNVCICGSKSITYSNKQYSINPLSITNNTELEYFVPDSTCYSIDIYGNCLFKCSDYHDEYCTACFNGSCIVSKSNNLPYTSCESQNYYNSTLRRCDKCTKLFPSCYDCSNNECLLCKIGNETKQCPCKNDQMYLSSNDLAILNKKYYGYNFNCIPCSSQLYCVNYQNLGLCSDHIPSCTNCLNGKCIQCKSGYFLNSNATCTSCTIFDKDCSVCDSNYCYTCSNSSVSILTTYQCKACGKTQCIYCSMISRNSDSLYCNLCNNGFYPKNSICYNCADFGNCQLCNLNGCKYCIPGFKLNSFSGLCTDSCSNSFNSCSNCTANYCTGCQSGYYLTDYNDCSLCSNIFPLCTICNYTNCQSCSLNSELNSYGDCICNSYYFKYGNSCVSILFPIVISMGFIIILIVIILSIYYYMRSKQSIVRNIESNHRIANAENNNNNDSVSENEANMNRQIKFSKNDGDMKSTLKRSLTKEIPEDELCQICFANKVNKILDCLHILCQKCLNEEIKRKVNTCPFCRRIVNFNNALDYVKIEKNENLDLNLNLNNKIKF